MAACETFTMSSDTRTGLAKHSLVNTGSTQIHSHTLSGTETQILSLTTQQNKTHGKKNAWGKGYVTPPDGDPEAAGNDPLLIQSKILVSKPSKRPTSRRDSYPSSVSSSARLRAARLGQSNIFPESELITRFRHVYAGRGGGYKGQALNSYSSLVPWSSTSDRYKQDILRKLAKTFSKRNSVPLTPDMLQDELQSNKPAFVPPVIHASVNDQVKANTESSQRVSCDGNPPDDESTDSQSSGSKKPGIKARPSKTSEASAVRVEVIDKQPAAVPEKLQALNQHSSAHNDICEKDLNAGSIKVCSNSELSEVVTPHEINDSSEKSNSQKSRAQLLSDCICISAGDQGAHLINRIESTGGLTDSVEHDSLNQEHTGVRTPQSSVCGLDYSDHQDPDGEHDRETDRDQIPSSMDKVGRSREMPQVADQTSDRSPLIGPIKVNNSLNHRHGVVRGATGHGNQSHGAVKKTQYSRPQVRGRYHRTTTLDRRWSAGANQSQTSCEMTLFSQLSTEAQRALNDIRQSTGNLYNQVDVNVLQKLSETKELRDKNMISAKQDIFKEKPKMDTGSDKQEEDMEEAMPTSSREREHRKVHNTRRNSKSLNKTTKPCVDETPFTQIPPVRKSNSPRQRALQVYSPSNKGAILNRTESPPKPRNGRLPQITSIDTSRLPRESDIDWNKGLEQKPPVIGQFPSHPIVMRLNREQTFKITPAGYDSRFVDMPVFPDEEDDTPNEVKLQAHAKCSEWINKYL